MKLRPDAWIIVERPHWEAKGFGIVVKQAYQSGTANLTESPGSGRGRMVICQQILASGPAKMVARNSHATSEGSTSRLAAHRAMPVQRRTNPTIDFVAYAATKTATRYHSCFSVRLVSKANLVDGGFHFRFWLTNTVSRRECFSIIETARRQAESARFFLVPIGKRRSAHRADAGGKPLEEEKLVQVRVVGQV